jgi:cytochrome c
MLIKKALLFTALGLCCGAPAFADLALATTKSCMSCHMVERKIIGPAFKDIAARYRDDKGAGDRLAAKIIKGGSGAWGPITMPANSQVSEADARKLAAWVLSLK